MTDIFATVSPMLLVTKFIGIAPFCMDESKKMLKVSLTGIVHSTIMLIVFLAHSSYFVYINIMYNNDDEVNSYITKATDLILLACGIAVTVCCILFSVIQRNKYIKVVQNFHSVGFEMGKLNEHISYNSLLKHTRIHLIVLFLILSLSLVYVVFLGEEATYTFMYISLILCQFGPKVYNFLMEYQFVSGALLLKIHFSILNKCMEKFEEPEKSIKDQNKILDIGINNNAWMENVDTHLNNKVLAQTFTVWEGSLSNFRTRKIWSSENSINSSPLFLEKIKIIRKIHSNLCEIKEHLNTSFSLQLLTSIAQAFIIITANLYKIFTTLSLTVKPPFSTLAEPILWSLAHTIELVIIVVTCTNASKTANYTAVLVHKLLAKECTSDVRNQLKLFSIQLLHRKLSFTASGFFTIDMTLLQAIMGAATTYLVILIQFHNTYEVTKE